MLYSRCSGLSGNPDQIPKSEIRHATSNTRRPTSNARCWVFLRNRRRVLGMIGLCFWLVLLSACSRQPAEPNANSQPEIGSPQTPQEPEFTFADTLPEIGGPEGYVGSESCRSCHEDEFNSWHQTYHRTMTQIATPDSVQANFDNVILTNDTTRFVLSRSGDAYRVRMESLDPRPDGTAPPSLDTQIGLITGSHHMQVFWVPSGAGNTQIGFPFTWLIPEKRWVPRNSTFIRPPDMVHRSEVWNLACIRCHATGIEPRVDVARRTSSTRIAELGISCEACHGPGERHIDLHVGLPGDPPTAAAQPPEDPIIHPRQIDPIRASQICGFCHSMKWIDATEDWRSHGFRYRPGDDLEKTTPIIHPEKAEEIPGLTDFLRRNPDILHDFFWPDGMVRVSGREYNGLVESPCYKGGQFSCLSCHSMHASHPNDQLARNRLGNGACIQCHEKFREQSQLTLHTRHAADSSGSECYNCHMPHTTYGVLKAIRSHQITSPNVADQLASGRPNACNLCHLDKSLAWTADKLNDWFSHPKPQLSSDQTEVSDAVRLALSGDASQRALLAWHLSWEPAVQISKQSWLPPILAVLLDDPYAAVRCIAERSLNQIGDLTPSGYDYTIDPLLRPSVRSSVIQNWSHSISARPDPPAISKETLVRWDDLHAMEQALERISRNRDNTPVRLRE